MGQASDDGVVCNREGKEMENLTVGECHWKGQEPMEKSLS